MGNTLHDDFCAKARFRCAECTCGGDEGQSYRAIVDAVNRPTEDEMRRIARWGRTALTQGEPDQWRTGREGGGHGGG